jgi:hypothetical protein
LWDHHALHNVLLATAKSTAITATTEIRQASVGRLFMLAKALHH